MNRLGVLGLGTPDALRYPVSEDLDHHRIANFRISSPSEALETLRARITTGEKNIPKAHYLGLAPLFAQMTCQLPGDRISLDLRDFHRNPVDHCNYRYLLPLYSSL